MAPNGDGTDTHGSAFRGHRRENRRALSAIGQAIGGIFNITAGKNSSRLREQGGANLEPGIRSVSVPQGRLGCVQKRLPLVRG